MIFQHADSGSGWRVVTDYPTGPGGSGSKVGPRPGWVALPSQGHSHRDPEDTPVHLRCTPLGNGRKPESSEKTRTGVGRMCQLHTGLLVLARSRFSSSTSQGNNIEQNAIIQGPTFPYFPPTALGPGPLGMAAMWLPCLSLPSWGLLFPAGGWGQEPQAQPPGNERFLPGKHVDNLLIT